MVAEAVAGDVAVTVEASGVELVVVVIVAHLLLQQFKTRTSSQLLVGSEKKICMYHLNSKVSLRFRLLATLILFSHIISVVLLFKTNNCAVSGLFTPCVSRLCKSELFVTCENFVVLFSLPSTSLILRV